MKVYKGFRRQYKNRQAIDDLGIVYNLHVEFVYY